MSLLSRPSRRATGTHQQRPGLIARVRAAWHDDARRDRVPLWVADTVGWTPIVGTIGLGVVYLLSRPTYYAVLREDHSVEWLQFALLLFTGLLALLAARRTLRQGWLVPVLLLVLALGALGLAGEEISWGQRAFAFGTPEALAAVNQQAEVNVHNVNVGGLRLQRAFKFVSFLLAVAGLVLAWRTRGPGRVLQGRFWEAVAVPIYTVVGSLTMIGYWAVIMVAPLNPVVRYQEWAEASLYLSLAATAYAIATRSLGVVGSGRIDSGRPAREPRDVAVLVALGVSVALTLVLAALTAYHGIIPLNAREGMGS